MNKLRGTIIKVESTDSLSLVDVEVGADTFTSLLLETPATSPFLSVGNEVYLVFKETEVSISKDLSCRLSLRNRIRSVVREVEKGMLLSRLLLDYGGNNVESIITTRSVDWLAVAVGDVVEGLVKANEMMIMEVPDAVRS